MTPASNGQGEGAEIPLEARQLAGLIQCTPGQSSGFAISEGEAAKRIHAYAQAVAKKAATEARITGIKLIKRAFLAHKAELAALRAELAEICRLACGDDGMTAKEAVLRQAQTCATVVRDLNREAIAYLQRAESAEATAALLRAKEPESAESVPPERSV